MDHKIYEFVTIAIIFFIISIFILVTNLYFSISARREAIQRDDKKNKRFDDLSYQVEELKRLFKTDVKDILDGVKSVLNQTK